MAVYLPNGTNYPRQRVSAEFGWYDALPHGNGALGFKLLVPRMWQQDLVPGGEVEPRVDRLLPLAAFSSHLQDGFLEIQVTSLERDISAGHWLQAYMEEVNYEPLAIVDVSKIFADSLAEFVIEGRKFIGRFSASIRGNLLFLVSALSFKESYDALAEMFGVSIASFQATAVPPRLTVESRVSASVDGIVHFEYPASWQSRVVSPSPHGKAAVDLIGTLGDALTGIIRVKTVRKSLASGPEQLISASLAEFEEAGIQSIEKQAENNVPISGNKFSNGMVKIYSGITSAGLPQEIWVVVMENAHVHCVISMVTPDRNLEFAVWAVNRRALDIILETIN